jgi:hypothetical protein
MPPFSPAAGTPPPPPPVGVAPSPISSRPPPEGQHHHHHHHHHQQQQQADDLGGSASSSSAAAGAAAGGGGIFADHEGAAGGDEGERGGPSGNRWPRQETLALLKIRSEMDAAFREAALKGPLWEQVSRCVRACVRIHLSRPILHFFSFTRGEKRSSISMGTKATRASRQWAADRSSGLTRDAGLHEISLSNSSSQFGQFRCDVYDGTQGSMQVACLLPSSIPDPVAQIGQKASYCTSKSDRPRPRSTSTVNQKFPIKNHTHIALLRSSTLIPSSELFS